MKTLYQLRDALDAAGNADDQELIRVMDKAIPDICGGWPWDSYPAPNPLKTIDAALALVERLLPGWGWTTSLYDPTHPKRWAFGAVVPPASDANKLDADGYEAHAQRAPLAILRALVAALIAQEKTDEA